MIFKNLRFCTSKSFKFDLCLDYPATINVSSSGGVADLHANFMGVYKIVPKLFFQKGKIQKPPRCNQNTYVIQLLKALFSKIKASFFRLFWCLVDNLRNSYTTF